MSNRTTKEKGDITELEVILAFKNLGYQVSIPYGENSNYDIIADVNGKLLKIQCKTSRAASSPNTICFSTSKIHINRTTCKRRTYSAADIDYFATTWKGVCYLIPIKDAPTNQITLRFATPLNNQKSHIRNADDYEISKVLLKIHAGVV